MRMKTNPQEEEFLEKARIFIINDEADKLKELMYNNLNSNFNTNIANLLFMKINNKASLILTILNNNSLECLKVLESYLLNTEQKLTYSYTSSKIESFSFQNLSKEFYESVGKSQILNIFFDSQLEFFTRRFIEKGKIVTQEGIIKTFKEEFKVLTELSPNLQEFYGIDAKNLEVLSESILEKINKALKNKALSELKEFDTLEVTKKYLSSKKELPSEKLALKLERKLKQTQGQNSLIFQVISQDNLMNKLLELAIKINNKRNEQIKDELKNLIINIKEARTSEEIKLIEALIKDNPSSLNDLINIFFENHYTDIYNEGRALVSEKDSNKFEIFKMLMKSKASFSVKDIQLFDLSTTQGANIEIFKLLVNKSSGMMEELIREKIENLVKDRNFQSAKNKAQYLNKELVLLKEVLGKTGLNEFDKFVANVVDTTQLLENKKMIDNLEVQNGLKGIILKFVVVIIEAVLQINYKIKGKDKIFNDVITKGNIKSNSNFIENFSENLIKNASNEKSNVTNIPNNKTNLKGKPYLN